MADQASLIRQPPNEPMIRTMKSDVATFLKTNKPSLVSILAEQARTEGPIIERSSHHIFWSFFLGALTLAVLGTIGTLWYVNSKHTPPPSTSEIVTPAPFFFYERVTELAIPRSRKDLLSALQRASGSAPIGSFERLVIRAADPAQGNPILGIGDIFVILGIESPLGFTDSITGPPQLFIYQERSGPRFGMILETRNPSRVLQALFSWEPSIQHDLNAFFLGASAPSTLRPFLDMTYRNTDYRYLSIDQGRDLGIGYLQFEARHLIVITTSEESLRLTLNRLFENR
jgi:hypothetical protein